MYYMFKKSYPFVNASGKGIFNCLQGQNFKNFNNKKYKSLSMEEPKLNTYNESQYTHEQ